MNIDGFVADFLYRDSTFFWVWVVTFASLFLVFLPLSVRAKTGSFWMSMEPFQGLSHFLSGLFLLLVSVCTE